MKENKKMKENITMERKTAQLHVINLIFCKRDKGTD